MKTLILIPLLLAGCVRTSFNPSTGAFNRVSFGTQAKFSELVIQSGTNHVSLKGYTSDQVESLKAIAEGVARGLTARPVTPSTP